MTNQDALNIHLKASRHCRRIAEDDPALQVLRAAVSRVRQALDRSLFRDGTVCSFLAVSSTRSECEMLNGASGQIMILDCSLVELLHSVNSLRAAGPAQSAAICSAARQLGLASMSCAKFAAAMFCHDVSEHFSGDMAASLNGAEADTDLLLAQTVFLVLHELSHWSLHQAPDWRAAIDAVYDDGLGKSALRHITSVLSENNLRRLTADAVTANELSAFHVISQRCAGWLTSHKEEVVCDFLAIRRMFGNSRTAPSVHRAMLAGATVPLALELRSLAVSMAGSGLASLPEALDYDRQVRYFVYTAIAHAAALEVGIAEHGGDSLRDQVHRYMHLGIDPVLDGMKQVMSNFQLVAKRGDVTEVEKRGRRANRESACENYGIARGDPPVYVL